MEFVPYSEFRDVNCIAEGGFSKIYKAIWINGPRYDSKQYKSEMTVVLKELANSKDITSKHLNELKIFNDFVSSCEYPSYLNFNDYNKINTYYGITQCPETENFLIITKYYESGNLSHYITNNFFNMDWGIKLNILNDIIIGLKAMHDAEILHKDYHSGNIFIDIRDDDWLQSITGDLGLSKSSLVEEDDDEIYGILPYVAPEVLQVKKYTKASDIYSIGMIMWELMIGRRPFWDRNYDTELIIEIVCDELRPPIVTNAPKGYIDLMQKCWHFDPSERPTAVELQKNIENILVKEPYSKTKIMRSSDIGPITTNNLHKNGLLSEMIKSAESTMILLDYSIKSHEFDIINFIKSNNDGYVSRELGFNI
ncbi:kinase-like domain-containing protein [Rhizophagus diaphanus]|nr:kinase-like domain-containing protein [Rhizophagus diaphanus] [Rhizophagus sp. MUCL 43196]